MMRTAFEIHVVFCRDGGPERGKELGYANGF